MDHFKGLTNVQGPRRAIRVPPIVGKDAVANVGMLLHLAQKHTGTNCVGASCRNEEGIFRRNGEARQELLDIGIRQCLTKLIQSDARLQSEAEFGTWAGSNCIPHFRFTYSSGGGFMLAGVLIIRVNLHGKLVLREDELYKQGNARASLQAVSLPFSRKPTPGFAERE